MITEDSDAGYQAWLDAYHGYENPYLVVSPLLIPSGQLQAAINLEYVGDSFSFDTLSIIYEGTNGQLANLDLINTAVIIAEDYFGINVCVQEVTDRTDNYQNRLTTLLRGMAKQAAGLGKGHGAFAPYRVDAITLRVVSSENGKHGSLSFGSVIESCMRSLNNLLEHLHQSFFFYLLLTPRRFVSIGTYLQSALLISSSYSLTAIAEWNKGNKGSKSAGHVVYSIGILVIAYAIGFMLFTGLNIITLMDTTKKMYVPFFAFFHVAEVILPLKMENMLNVFFGRDGKSIVHTQTLKTFSMLLLGSMLAALSCINFSLGLFVGLSAFPLMFSSPAYRCNRYLVAITAKLFSPLTMMHFIAFCYGEGFQDLLDHYNYAWRVWGTAIPVVWWAVWWPHWLVFATICSQHIDGPLQVIPKKDKDIKTE